MLIHKIEFIIVYLLLYIMDYYYWNQIISFFYFMQKILYLVYDTMSNSSWSMCVFGPLKKKDYKKTKKQGDLDDAREIPAVWTYFRGNQVELFKILKEFGKWDHFYFC